MEKESCELKIRNFTINLLSQLTSRFKIYKAAHKIYGLLRAPHIEVNLACPPVCSSNYADHLTIWPAGLKVYIAVCLNFVPKTTEQNIHAHIIYSAIM